ncbi:hypothetical protein [Deinococcus aestuarii]|uniref:hypothetical protein n=1 Tax=Deinococcus aestuarii TaxID=2774531 RepID=UPI001C0AB1C2|nr:hypothetical protein [Deinococcus aestuarii]
MMHSGDEFYGDEITSGPNLEDLHGQDWNEANDYTNELDDPGEPPEDDGGHGSGDPDPSGAPRLTALPPEEEDLPF